MGNRDETSWRLLEQIAAALEKSLDPKARVEHSIKLPVLGTRRSRQCDIVITYGDSPRQTLAIAEVQKRNRKPDITTFHGWVQKMREVGAQHLLCVSARGFPNSIMEEVVTRIGPTVRLLTLQEIEQPEIPGLIFPESFVIHKDPTFAYEAIGPEMRLENADERAYVTFQNTDKVFEVKGTNESLSLNEITQRALEDVHFMFHQKGLYEPTSYVVKLVLGSAERHLWIRLRGRRLRVLSLPLTLRIQQQVSKIPLSCYSYEQEFFDGVLAWVVSAGGRVGDKEIATRLVFRPDEAGYLRPAFLHSEGSQATILYGWLDEESAKAGIKELLK